MNLINMKQNNEKMEPITLIGQKFHYEKNLLKI